MAEGTGAKVLDQKLSKVDERLEGVVSHLDANQKTSNSRFEALEAKLDKTLQILAEVVTLKLRSTSEFPLPNSHAAPPIPSGFSCLWNC